MKILKVQHGHRWWWYYHRLNTWVPYVLVTLLIAAVGVFSWSLLIMAS